MIFFMTTDFLDSQESNVSLLTATVGIKSYQRGKKQVISIGHMVNSSPVVLVKWKNKNLYQVCSDFHILNEKLVKINHAFPLVRDCIEQLGRKKCHYLSTIDLRDAFHMIRLALSLQKYCGITPYYGSPTYHYLCMGMGMSVSPQIWQQFVDLVVQDDLIKHKQNFDVIMN